MIDLLKEFIPIIVVSLLIVLVIWLVASGEVVVQIVSVNDNMCSTVRWVKGSLEYRNIPCVGVYTALECVVIDNISSQIVRKVACPTIGDNK